MIERFLYKNHLGETIEFGKNGFFANKNDLRDWNYSVNSKNERITSMKKGIVKKTIPIQIACLTDQEGIAARNKLFEIMEKDVLSGQHGRFIVGDYYLKCFVTQSKKTEYLRNKRTMNVSLTINTDFPLWTKETMTAFNYRQGSTGKNLDFNNDFPFDYTSNLIGKEIVNTNFVPSNFRMRIYGPIINPKVTIGGHEYEVTKELQANEYLAIDSTEKTIKLTHTDGSIENCFNLRNRDSYIFEKIPVGTSNVAASGNFKFDVTILDERGEPLWI